MFRRPASGDMVSKFTRRWVPGDSDFRQWLDDELDKLVQMHIGDQAQRESSTSKIGLAPVQATPSAGPRPASLEPAAVLDTVDEASEQSFPASDAPAWILARD